MNDAPIVPADIAAAAAADASAPPVAQGEGGRPWSPGAPAIGPAAPGPDYTAEARDLVNTAIALLTPVYPSLAPIYTADVCERIAAAGAPLMEKYKLTLGALGPEIMFALTVIPLIAPTVQAVRHDREQAKTRQQATTDAAAAPIAGAVPGADAAAGAGVERDPRFDS